VDVLAGAGDTSTGWGKGTVLEGAGVDVLEGATKVILGKSIDELGTTSEVGVGQ